MRNNGIGIIGLLFIILLIAVIFGTTSIWHIIFFPFYVLGGILGFILGIALICLVIIGICAICIKIFN